MALLPARHRPFPGSAQTSRPVATLLNPPPRIAFVIPAYNRRPVTLGCLEWLAQHGVSGWARFIVVDDGSTDGTAEAIVAAFPEVTVLRGDGQLWWAGAIVLGMREAVAQDATMIFWLNDDCRPRPGALERMRDHTQGTGEISVAQTISLAGGAYTGWTRTWRGLRQIHVPPGQQEHCDTFPGNCVAIPRAVVDRLGYPDAEHMPHVFGDADYGFKAGRAGFRMTILGDALCDDFFTDNAEADSWLFGERSFRDRWRSLKSVKSYYYIPAYWLRCTRHWGLWGVVLFAFPYLKMAAYGLLRAAIPRPLLLAFFGPFSHELRKQQALKPRA